MVASRGWTALLLAGGIGACIGQNGDGITGTTVVQTGEDGGPPAPPVTSGSLVTWLETRSPADASFVLRGTIPVPPGTFPRSDGASAFTIHDFDGTPLDTQTEIVSRYAKDTEGADVVEVLAHVRRNPTYPEGVQVRYEVRATPQPVPAAPASPSLADLAQGPNALAPVVRGLLADPQAIEITTYDCFGNAYVARPLDGSGTVRRTRYGPVETELRVYQTMTPVLPVSGAQGTLPHAFGVHAYLRTSSLDEIVGLDLRFHNGHSGRDAGDPLDDALGTFYFERIDITVPDDFLVEQDFADPLFGATTFNGGRRTVSLVAPNGDGTMHVMRWQAQMHRRIVLTTPFERPLARSYLEDGTGFGFCVPGTDPADGHALWSWWNRGTARYFPQRYQLPNLDHVGAPTLRAELEGTHAWLRDHLVNGTGDGTYPIVVGNLDWAHPWGVAYGGMTGGSEIHLSDGIECATSASTRGLVAFRATHRMQSDRQRTVLYDADGEPSAVERWVQNGPSGPWVPFEHFILPNLAISDPFGVTTAPQFQVQYVEGTGKQPACYATYMSYDPYDYQHFVRYTRSAKVLAWLANDSVAKDDLRMQAEAFHLSYHTWPNYAGGGFQASGMGAARAFVNATPGVGLPFGRGEAWGLDCAIAAFATSDLAWRAKTRGWFEDLAELLADGQSACSGFLQATVSPKFFNSNYRSRQEIEQAITENMLQGLRETVFRGDDAAHADLVRDVLRESLYAFISPLAWKSGQAAPAAQTAMGPLDPTRGVWCTAAGMPSGGWVGFDTYQNWSSFAYAYEITGDSLFLTKATQESGGGILLGNLEQSGTGNLPNRAALLALMQRLAGKL
jgi:hypothetical protein